MMDLQYSNEVLLVVTLAVMALGLLGSILPVFPGGPVILIAALVYSYLTGFEVVGPWSLAAIAALTLLSFIADLWGTAYGSRRGGASWAGTVGGAVGGIVGTLVGALFFGIGALAGLFIGTLAGIFAGEYLLREQATGAEARPAEGSTATGNPGTESLPREEGNGQPSADDRWQRASRAAGGAFVGWIISIAAKFGLALASVAVFVAALIW